MHQAECDEIWPLGEKDIQCKIPEEMKAETEELNPQPYYKSQPRNPHRVVGIKHEHETAVITSLETTNFGIVNVLQQCVGKFCLI